MTANKHYIRVNEAGNIVDGWSDGPNRGKDAAGAVLIREEGSYQFRLFSDGEENPALFNGEGIALYRWNGTEAVARTPEELTADGPDSDLPIPSLEERVRAMEAAILMLMEG